MIRLILIWRKNLPIPEDEPLLLWWWNWWWLFWPSWWWGDPLVEDPAEDMEHMELFLEPWKNIFFKTDFTNFSCLSIYINSKYIPKDDGDDGGVWNVNPSAFISFIICSVAGGNW